MTLLNYATADMVDVNGDGFLDRVVVLLDEDEDPTGLWHVYLARQFPSIPALGIEQATVPKPYLLSSMGNEMGGVNSIFYNRSTMYNNTGEDGVPDMPFVQWLVKATRLNDGRCTPPLWTDLTDPAENECIEDANGVGHEIIRKYFYQGGMFVVEDDGAKITEREFRGFRRVTSLGLSGSFSVTYFHQEAGLRGRTEAVETWALDPSTFNTVLVGETVKVWTIGDHPDNSSRAQVVLESETRARYDLGAAEPHVSVTENLSVDSYGRVLHSATYGEVGGSEVDRVELFTSYATPTGIDFRPYDKPSVAYTRAGGSSTDLEKRTFFYDQLATSGSVSVGNVTKIVSWNDRGADSVTSMLYDGYGNLAWVQDPIGGITATQYDDGWGTFLAPIVVSKYMSLVDWVAGTNAYSSATVMDYRTGQTWIEWGPGGQVGGFGLPDNMIFRTFDAAGRTTCVALPGDSTAGGTNCTVKTTFSLADGTSGSLTSITTSEKWDTNSNRRTSTTFFDALGRAVRTEVDGVIGSSTTLATTVKDDIEYDIEGRILRRYFPYEETSSRVNGAAEFDYGLNGENYQDPLGRVWKTTFPDGTFTRTEYEGIDTVGYDQMQLKTVSTVDTFDRVIRTEVFAAGGGTAYTVNESQYDELGRVTGVLQNGILLKDIKYDSLGRKYWMADRDAGDDDIAAAVGIWEYYHDASGNLIVQDDPESGQHIQYFYDGLGRLTKRCYMTIDYLSGAPVSCAAASSDAEVEYFFDNPADPHGRGRLWKVDDGAGTGEILDYDRRGRELTVSRMIEVDAGQAVAQFGYAYTNSGTRKRVNYPGDDGEYVITEFNLVGQPTGVAGYTGYPGVLKDRYIQSVEYDVFGRATATQHSNGFESAGSSPNYSGVIDTRTYYGNLDMFRLSGIKVTHGSTLMHLQGFGYNERGQLTDIVDALHSDAQTNAAVFVYDGYGRLASYSNGYDPSRSYDYNSMGNITEKGPLSFTYDHTERTHRIIEVQGLPGGPKPINYDYNGNRVLNHDGEQYEYDHEDRLAKITNISGGDPVTFYYDAEGYRRARVVNDGIPGSERITRYFGDLVQTTADGHTTRRYFLGATLVASREIEDDSWQIAGGPPFGAPGSMIEVATDNWQGRPVLVMGLAGRGQVVAAVALFLILATPWVLPGRSRRVIGVRLQHGQVTIIALLFLCSSGPWPLLVRPAQAQTPVETVRHYHTDHLDSVQLVTDEDGGIVEEIRYYPYGEIRGRFDGFGTPLSIPNGGDTVRFEFTGHETELNSGLIYAGARFLDPVTGTFLTQDPAAQFLNPFAYGPWDPVNGTDPSGASFLVALFAIAKFFVTYGAAIGAIGGFVGTFAQTLADGGDFIQALEAGGSGLLLGFYTSLVIGGIGAALPKNWAVAYAVAVIGAGAVGTVRGFTEGDYISAGIGAALLALGIARMFVGSGARPATQSRRLAGSEIDELEQLYYGRAINWGEVTVDNGLGGGGRPWTFGNTIHMGDGYSAAPIPPGTERFALLAHEAGHVADFSDGFLSTLGSAIRDQVAYELGADVYNPALTGGQNLSDFGAEGRATLYEWVYREYYPELRGVSGSNYPATGTQRQTLYDLVYP